MAAADRALQLAASARRREECLLVLLSGGASAMLAAPADGLSLQDKVETTSALLRAGVAIDGLNAVRKHLSRIKGGRLAARGVADDDARAFGRPRRQRGRPGGHRIGSDRGGSDDLRGRARGHREERGRRTRAAVRAHLERGRRGEREETLKPGDPRLASSTFDVIGNRHTALEAALRAAQARGYVTHTLPAATSGEAREAAQRFFAEAKWLAADGPGRCACWRPGRRR